MSEILEYTEVHDTIVTDVIKAYTDVLEYFDPMEFAPELNEIYLAYCCNIIDNIHDVYEEVFGVGSEIRDEWLNDLGIDRNNIPPLRLICRVLNDLKLGYIYRGKLYNIMPQTLLVERGIIDNAI